MPDRSSAQVGIRKHWFQATKWDQQTVLWSSCSFQNVDELDWGLGPDAHQAINTNFLDWGLRVHDHQVMITKFLTRSPPYGWA